MHHDDVVFPSTSIRSFFTLINLHYLWNNFSFFSLLSCVCVLADSLMTWDSFMLFERAKEIVYTFPTHRFFSHCLLCDAYIHNFYIFHIFNIFSAPSNMWECFHVNITYAHMIIFNILYFFLFYVSLCEWREGILFRLFLFHQLK